MFFKKTFIFLILFSLIAFTVTQTTDPQNVDVTVEAENPVNVNLDLIDKPADVNNTENTEPAVVAVADNQEGQDIDAENVTGEQLTNEIEDFKNDETALGDNAATGDVATGDANTTTVNESDIIETISGDTVTEVINNGENEEPFVIFDLDPQTSNGNIYIINVNKEFQFKIPSEPSTGYQWNLPPDVRDAISGGIRILDSTEFGSFIPNDNNTDNTTSEGYVFFTFSPIAEGEYNFVFDKERSFENTPIEKISVTVRVLAEDIQILNNVEQSNNTEGQNGFLAATNDGDGDDNKDGEQTDEIVGNTLQENGQDGAVEQEIGTGEILTNVLDNDKDNAITEVNNNNPDDGARDTTTDTVTLNTNQENPEEDIIVATAPNDNNNVNTDNNTNNGSGYLVVNFVLLLLFFIVY